jgi:hypothetical protein
VGTEPVFYGSKLRRVKEVGQLVVPQFEFKEKTMKVVWLNDSLVLRGENSTEKQALATVYEALEPKEAFVQSTGVEETEPKGLSAS